MLPNYIMLNNVYFLSRKLELFGRPHNVQPNWVTLGNQLDGVVIHDEEMLRKKRIPTGELRNRHRRNTITFLGQFYSFIVEFGITMVLIYSMRDQSDISYRMFIVIYNTRLFEVLGWEDTTHTTIRK